MLGLLVLPYVLLARVGDDKRPVEIRIYGGGKTNAVGRVLARWQA